MSLRGPIRIGANRQRSTFISLVGSTTVNIGTSAGGYISVGRVSIDGRDTVGADIALVASMQCVNDTSTGSIFLYDVTAGDVLLATYTISTDIATDVEIPITTINKAGPRILELRGGLDPAGSYTATDGFTILAGSLRLREY